jgi:hypothetical protein
MRPSWNADPQFTEAQLATIARWADSTKPISEVRLFGNRARGDAREALVRK